MPSHAAEALLGLGSGPAAMSTALSTSGAPPTSSDAMYTTPSMDKNSTNPTAAKNHAAMQAAQAHAIVEAAEEEERRLAERLEHVRAEKEAARARAVEIQSEASRPAHGGAFANIHDPMEDLRTQLTAAGLSLLSGAVIDGLGVESSAELRTYEYKDLVASLAQLPQPVVLKPAQVAKVQAFLARPSANDQAATMPIATASEEPRVEHNAPPPYYALEMLRQHATNLSPRDWPHDVPSPSAHFALAAATNSRMPMPAKPSPAPKRSRARAATSFSWVVLQCPPAKGEVPNEPLALGEKPLKRLRGHAGFAWKPIN